MKTNLLITSIAWPVAMAMVLSLSGCAAGVDRPDIREQLLDRGLELGESGVDIPRYRINGWSSIDDYNLIVTAGVNDRYLVQLSTPCQGLNGAFFVGFTTPGFGLNRFDDILVRGMDRRLERCPIQTISRLYSIDR